jgi:hypothetical protein
MTGFLCVTCGTQFQPSTQPPARCPICEDARQYIGPGGQRWTTLRDLRRGHDNVFRLLEPRLFGVGTTPAFAIGQRALLILAPGGNVLWDCISLIDDATIELVRALGGITSIAISHPHYYSSMVEWADAFHATIYLHEDDGEWVMRGDDRIRSWGGDSFVLDDGLTLLRPGGHFTGGTVLHWAGGAGGRGALLSGDILQVVPDRRYVSFMYSYPNLIPLPAGAIRRIERVLAPHAFDRIYGAWWDRVVESDGKACVQRSVDRYLAAIGAAKPAQKKNVP